jgi:hypothetical protein
MSRVTLEKASNRFMKLRETPLYARSALVNYIAFSYTDALFAQYYWGDQSKDNEMGGACGTHGGG